MAKVAHNRSVSSGGVLSAADLTRFAHMGTDAGLTVDRMLAVVPELVRCADGREAAEPALDVTEAARVCVLLSHHLEELQIKYAQALHRIEEQEAKHAQAESRYDAMREQADYTTKELAAVRATARDAKQRLFAENAALSAELSAAQAERLQLLDRLESQQHELLAAAELKKEVEMSRRRTQELEEEVAENAHNLKVKLARCRESVAEEFGVTIASLREELGKWQTRALRLESFLFAVKSQVEGWPKERDSPTAASSPASSSADSPAGQSSTPPAEHKDSTSILASLSEQVHALQTTLLTDKLALPDQASPTNAHR